MENGQPTSTENESGSKAATSDGSMSSQPSESTVPAESKNSSPTTQATATTRKGSKKTSKNVDLAVLKSKAGLVAGVISDWQTAKGGILRVELPYTMPSGRTYKALKLILFLPGHNIVAVDTPDGITFDIVAVPDSLVVEKETDENQ